MNIQPGTVAVVAVIAAFTLVLLFVFWCLDTFRFRLLVPQHFYDSYFINYRLLAILRILTFLFCLGTVIYLGVDEDDGRRYRFYQNITFLVLTVYMFMAMINSLIAWIFGPDEFDWAFYHSWLFRKRCYLSWILYMIAFPAVIWSVVIFWAVIFPRDDDDDRDGHVDYTMVVTSGVSLILILMEMWFSAMPLSPVGWAYSMILPIVYVYAIWVAVKSGASWPYSVMDTDKHYSPYWYMGGLLIHILFYYLAFAATSVRDLCAWCCNRRQAFARNVPAHDPAHPNVVPAPYSVAQPTTSSQRASYTGAPAHHTTIYTQTQQASSYA